MRASIIFTLLACCFLSTSKAQNSPVFFKDSIAFRNVSGIRLSFENTIQSGIAYDRIINLSGRNISVGFEVESPLYLLQERNKRFTLNSSGYLLQTDFNVRTRISVSLGAYEDALSTGRFMDVALGLFPGFYMQKYFVAAELSYRNNLFTTFNFNDISPIQQDVTLTNTTGNFFLGVNGGLLLKDRFELKTAVHYIAPRNFKNYPPFTQNIGFIIGAGYWF